MGFMASPDGTVRAHRGSGVGKVYFYYQMVDRVPRAKDLADWRSGYENYRLHWEFELYRDENANNSFVVVPFRPNSLPGKPNFPAWYVDLNKYRVWGYEVRQRGGRPRAWWAADWNSVGVYKPTAGRASYTAGVRTNGFRVTGEFWSNIADSIAHVHRNVGRRPKPVPTADLPVALLEYLIDLRTGDARLGAYTEPVVAARLDTYAKYHPDVF